jgi:DNA replication and repair protein RecF
MGTGTLSRLQVWDFRNLRRLDMAFVKGVTVLIGSNGQGKSNVLEAIFYLAGLRSFRTQGVAELRHWAAEAFTLRGEIGASDPRERLTVAVSQGAKRYLQLNGMAVERASDFINRFLCIPLVPEDMEMVKGAASVRRRFLDSTISQRWGPYLGELQRYREAVNSRNLALRSPQQYPASVLKAYEEVIVRHGARVEWLRREHVADLGETLRELSVRLLGGQRRVLAVSYACPGITKDSPVDSEDVLEAVLAEALWRNSERDRREGHTSVGPHRADLAITLNGRALGTCGSEGECRMACLALRLASLDRARQEASTTRAVVALVDDVIGELDSPRRGAFLEAVQQADQVIVTATATPLELVGRAAATYCVQEGVVSVV